MTAELARVQEKKEGVTHNCGVVGYFFSEPSDTSRVLQSLNLLQHRGQEGTGITVIDASGQVITWKTSFKISDADLDSGFEHFKSSSRQVRIAVGQTRYSTSGSLSSDANQPFYDSITGLITAHNGTLTNPKLFGSYYEGVSSDTKALHDEIISNNAKSIEEKIASVLPGVEGAYSLIFAEQNALYGVCDPRAMRPLVFGKLKNNQGYVFASEDVAIRDQTDYIEEVPPGVGIAVEGVGERVFVRKFFLDPRDEERRSCIFEPIYFSRQDARVFGMSVGEFRARCGAELAYEDFNTELDFDFVVPVPRSGLRASEGYVNAVEGIRLSYALNRNDDSRTFIENFDREAKVRAKFTVDPSAVKDKKIVVVDDSLVRGTTSRVLTQMFREAGATKVHWRFASPPIQHPCFWGIDFPTQQELLAFNKNDKEIAEEIGADSVRFVSLDTTMHIAESLVDHRGFCTHCFSGERPMEIDVAHMIMKRR